MSESVKVARTLEGTVVSNKGDKTIVVLIERRVSHPLYGKVITKSTKVHAHDEENMCKMGDVVQVAESKPFSKMKTWVLQQVIKSAVE